MPPRPIVGDLCQRLVDAVGLDIAACEADLAARAAVADFLCSSLPEWVQRFPEPLCWTWTRLAPDAIEVFGAAPIPRGDAERESTSALLSEVSASLHLAGFLHVRLHAHAVERILSCACVWRTP